MGTNRYGYVAGDPVNRVDPSGMAYAAPLPRDPLPPKKKSGGGTQPPVGNGSTQPLPDTSSNNVTPTQAVKIQYSMPFWLLNMLKRWTTTKPKGPASTIRRGGAQNIDANPPRDFCRVFFSPYRGVPEGMLKLGIDQVVWDSGPEKYKQAQRAEFLTRDCKKLEIVGFSAGADAAMIFADGYPNKEISGMALFGPTLTGQIVPYYNSTEPRQDISDGENMGLYQSIWQYTLNRLINSGARVFILNDSTQVAINSSWKSRGRDLNALLSNFSQSNNYWYVMREKLDHNNVDASVWPELALMYLETGENYF